jgi:hypothetical protein
MFRVTGVQTCALPICDSNHDVSFTDVARNDLHHVAVVLNVVSSHSHEACLVSRFLIVSSTLLLLIRERHEDEKLS